MNDLTERLFKFSVDSINILRKIPNDLDLLVIKKQLIRSSTSVGANYEEAQGANSKTDFHYKIRISLKEIRESNYWFRILKAVNNNQNINQEFDDLINESQELKNTLGAICKKSQCK